MANLLQMSSGLAFNESYFNPLTSDALPMLFGPGRNDMGAFAANKPLEHQPGTHWSYASGTTNIVSRIIRDQVGGTAEGYSAFMQTALFDVIGMTSAEGEFDGSGTLVGSSWIHATARDWARFGLLALRGGHWDGQQLVPEGWINWSRTPLDHEESGQYGAFFWLNVGNDELSIPRRIPNGPKGIFMASGFRGQYVVMVPSKDLVIVRLGRTGSDHYADVYRWIGNVISAFPDVEPSIDAD
jgi:CubicO group peptidase (beta-lactamase class C family)